MAGTDRKHRESTVKCPAKISITRMHLCEGKAGKYISLYVRKKGMKQNLFCHIFPFPFFTEVWHFTGRGQGDIHSWIWGEFRRSTSLNYKQWEWGWDDFSKECRVAFITTWENTGKILDGLKKHTKNTTNCPGKRTIVLFQVKIEKYIFFYFILPNSNAVVHMWVIGFLFIFISPNEINVIR